MFVKLPGIEDNNSQFFFIYFLFNEENKWTGNVPVEASIKEMLPQAQLMMTRRSRSYQSAG
jgi:hypothetical protein